MHKSFVLRRWILVLIVFVAARWWILLSCFVVFVSYWCAWLVLCDIMIHVPDIEIPPLGLVSCLLYFSLVCSVCDIVCCTIKPVSKVTVSVKLSKYQGFLFLGLKDVRAIERRLYFTSHQTCMCIKMYHSQTEWYSTLEKIFYPQYPDS